MNGVLGVLTIYTLLYMDNFPSQRVKLPEGNPQKDGATNNWDRMENGENKGIKWESSRPITKKMPKSINK